MIMSFEVRLQRPDCDIYNSRNGSELMVTSVYKHVQHHALIKYNSHISKIILILDHSSVLLKSYMVQKGKYVRGGSVLGWL